MKKPIFFIALFALCCVFILKAGVSYASTPFDEGFETYSLGDVAGQGIWSHRSSTGNYNVVSTEHYAGSKSLEASAGGAGRVDAMGGTDISVGSWTFWVKKANTSTLNVVLQSVDSNPELGCGNIFIDAGTNGKLSIYDMAGGYPIVDFDNTIYGDWFEITIEWNWGTGLYRAKLNEGTFSGWVHLYSACWTGDPLPAGTGLQGVRLFYSGTTAIYLDNFGEVVDTPVINITSPATGTTITDDTTNLVGNWAGIDPAIYHNISISLTSHFIGEQSVVKLIPITTPTGSFSFPLSYFGISANGQWDLEGSATYANTQLSDMYITTDLISPAGYNLIFDVEGFHTPFTFTDFDTWYDANVSNYESPSAWASGMIGYLQPILEKIAEFGARLQDYLDTSTAWQRGNDIGSVFPVINAYILKINIFFGGFPIAQFFQWGILIMIGMFAIKIILKLLSFIPVIGGGG